MQPTLGMGGLVGSTHPTGGRRVRTLTVGETFEDDEVLSRLRFDVEEMFPA